MFLAAHKGHDVFFFCFAAPQEGAGKNMGEVKIELERHPHLVVPRNRTPVALGVPLRTPREFPMEPGVREYRWASYGMNDLGDEVEEVDYMSQFNKRFNKVRANMLIFMSVFTTHVCFVLLCFHFLCFYCWASCTSFLLNVTKSNYEGL